jgi:hypothetical protein
MGLEYQIHSFLDGAGSLHNDCLALRAADEFEPILNCIGVGRRGSEKSGLGMSRAH